jgi:aryl-alcohol dehydrogenase-like predicted oxidoreductase
MLSMGAKTGEVRLLYSYKMNGWTSFTSMQNFYNLLYREEERKMNLFCKAGDIGLTPWLPVARVLLIRPWNVQTERSRQGAKSRK